ncbi:uncharacterized protein METZ01_LOCUS274882, partial [marine metagenome]
VKTAIVMEAKTVLANQILLNAAVIASI